MKLHTIIKWILAFLCLGSLGVKLHAQTIGSSGCQGTYGANFSTLMVGTDGANGSIYEINPVNGAFETEHAGNTNNYELNIGNTFGYSSDGTDSGSMISLSDTANASDYLSFDLKQGDFSAGGTAGFTFQINSISVALSAVGGGTVGFDLYLDNVLIGNNTNLGSAFTGYTHVQSFNDAGPTFQIRMYDSGTNVTEFRVDSIDVSVSAVNSLGVHNVCDGTNIVVPEPSSTILIGFSGLGFLLRRRR